jgi:O-acetyl-ADP-ribose deacetylase (regulator of RNase III)
VNAANQSVSVGSNTGIAGSITVAAGDRITCTFTNTRRPQVKLVKATRPDDGRWYL